MSRRAVNSQQLSLLDLLHAPVEAEIEVERPKTRGDCVDGFRPCPYVSCVHHLALDVMASGSLRLNAGEKLGSTLHQGQNFGAGSWMDRAVDALLKMPETCALDVADRGGITLEEIGALLNMKRERVRQIEEEALLDARVKLEEGDDSPQCDEYE